MDNEGTTSIDVGPSERARKKPAKRKNGSDGRGRLTPEERKDLRMKAAEDPDSLVLRKVRTGPVKIMVRLLKQLEPSLDKVQQSLSMPSRLMSLDAFGGLMEDMEEAILRLERVTRKTVTAVGWDYDPPRDLQEPAPVAAPTA